MIKKGNNNGLIRSNDRVSGSAFHSQESVNFQVHGMEPLAQIRCTFSKGHARKTVVF